MDPYSSPEIIPKNRLQNPLPHSLLRTRQCCQAAAESSSQELLSRLSVLEAKAAKLR